MLRKIGTYKYLSYSISKVEGNVMNSFKNIQLILTVNEAKRK